MSVEIGLMKEEEIPQTLELFREIIDELHLDSTEEHKNYYKENYNPDRVKELMKEDDNVFLVARRRGEVVGFLFSRIVWGVGTLNWVGVKEGERGKGVTTSLIRRTLSIFHRRNCFKADLFAYPHSRRLIHFLEGFGFEKRSYLEKTFLGTSVFYMVKHLRDVSPEYATRRIVIAGRAGQGIKLVAQVLSKILAKLGKEVSLRVEYGPSVRSGKVEAELVYSEHKIEVPMVDRANILVVLSTPEDKLPFARKIIVDESVRGFDPLEGKNGGNGRKCEEEIMSFAKTSQEKFGNFRFTSMVALGHLLKVIGVNIEKVNFESALPSKFIENNIKAIQHGFALRMDH